MLENKRKFVVIMDVAKEKKIDMPLGIDDDLSRKVTKGALWVTVSGICSRGLGIISSIILARLLLPSDYGLLAIATAIVSMMQGLTTTGFGSALIQKQEKPEEFLNTAWTFELAKYFTLFFILFFLAPLFALFFKEPATIAVLRVISFSLIFQGLTNIGIIYFRKKLDFKRQFIFNIIPQVIYIIVVIPLAFILRNVWALVWANVVRGLAVCAISYIMHPYRPRLDFNINKAKELFNFGKWILGSSIIVMVRQQGITMFVGKFLGIPMLGFYNRAEAFSVMLLQQLTEIIWQVGYPAYSQLQKVTVRLKRAYLLTLKILTFFGLPMAGGLLILSWDFTHLFLTDKWISIVPVIQVLCLSAMIGFITTPAGIMFQAVGRPSIGTKIAAAGVIILGITIYPLSLKWGTTGTAGSILLSTLITLPVHCYMAIKISKCSVREFITPILLVMINTGIMMSVIFSVKNYFFVKIGFVQFFSLVIGGAVIYFVVAYFFDRYFNYGIYKLIKDRIMVLK
ncbi:lipopolysaccharide biosynthesis protein [Candidatus Atribacteria bacterium MT.SAG.1]|nr:lipopolysaccharide biosynthesis protein [Candidatus Atribacteria bacterium MT.SAG.1]